MINAIQIALSGLNAASNAANVAASNIANVTTTGKLDNQGGSSAYQPQVSVNTALTGPEGEGLGVTATTIPSTRPAVPTYSPNSPDANADGLVATPDVDLGEQIVNLQLANTAYKANVKTAQAASDMDKDLLAIFDHKV